MPAHKKLREILLLQMKPQSDFRIPTGEFNAGMWDRVKKNELERYHYFQAVSREQDVQSTGLPELVVDFKTYFTVTTEEIYKRIDLSECKRHCFLNVPFRDYFSSRFFNYLSRVALPE